MENLLRVGVITSTHGVRGEVKVFPTTDDPQRFKKLKNGVYKKIAFSWVFNWTVHEERSFLIKIPLKS